MFHWVAGIFVPLNSPPAPLPPPPPPHTLSTAKKKKKEKEKKKKKKKLWTQPIAETSNFRADQHNQ